MKKDESKQTDAIFEFKAKPKRSQTKYIKLINSKNDGK